MSSKSPLSKTIKQLSKTAGFIDCGIAVARRLDEEEAKLKNWLSQGFHAEMQYMENHFEKRLDPTLLVPGSKSVISFLYNYFPAESQNTEAPIIAKYAYGEDYHTVIKDKLYSLVQELQQQIGTFNYRIFVDSAPVMERQWAALSGLGWIGKNSLLLRKGLGSYFFIGSIICDLDLEPDTPVTDHCGTCTACIDACPTQAIVANQVVDAGKCISYLTIEKKGDIPVEFHDQMSNRIFGCDICQEVCPWNHFSIPHQEPRFEPNSWIQWNKKDWETMDEVLFESHFSLSPLKRAGFLKLKNTLNHLD